MSGVGGRVMRVWRALPAALVLGAPVGSAAQTVCNDQWPAWSPDGQSIVFTSTRTGDHEIFVLSLATGRLTQLTDTPGRDAHPSFSPDGRTVAFQSPRAGGATNLYLIDVGGGPPRQVTDRSGFSGMPVWSPDGRRIAFQWRPEPPGARWRLMVLTLADGAVTELTDGRTDDQVVSWSPDGSRLVFHSDRTGRGQIYLWRDGTVTRVASTPFNDRSATWSPDGERLAYISKRGGETGGIYIMGVDGGDAQRVGTVEVEHGLPFFSPDGSRLLITPTTPTGTEIATLGVADGSVEVVSRCP